MSRDFAGNACWQPPPPRRPVAFRNASMPASQNARERPRRAPAPTSRDGTMSISLREGGAPMRSIGTHEMQKFVDQQRFRELAERGDAVVAAAARRAISGIVDGRGH